MIRVLFVCLGNICRSPMAEAVFAHKVREAGLGQSIATDSAGTGQWHIGELPHHGTRRVMSQHGITCDHRARQILASDLERFDYVLAMDRDNLANISAMGEGKAKVSLFLAYGPGSATLEVPDPYYSGNFEEVYSLVDAAADGLLAVIKADHGL